MTNNWPTIATCGMIMLDSVAADLEKEPNPGEIEWTNVTHDTPAGHPLDVAVDLVKLGYPAEYINIVGCIGNDFAGKFILQELTKYHLSSEYIKIVNQNTGRNIISVVKKEDRRFRLNPGANQSLDFNWVTMALSVLKPEILSIRPGYSGIDFEVDKLLTKLPEHCFVLLDLMKPKPEPNQDRLKSIRNAVTQATAVHCNDKEAIYISDTNSLQKAVDWFLQKGVKLIFLTFGERGAKAISNVNRDKTEIYLPAYKVKSVDPTGCGDAFCAGVIYKLVELKAYRNLVQLTQQQLVEILNFAQAVGAAAATQPGTTGGVSLERVKSIYKIN